jgi:hypothetical protein
MKVLVSQICVILSRGIVVATLDLVVASADGVVDELVGHSIEVAGETVRCLATWTCETGGLAGILLEIGRLVHNPGFYEMLVTGCYQ